MLATILNTIKITRMILLFKRLYIVDQKIFQSAFWGYLVSSSIPLMVFISHASSIFNWFLMRLYRDKHWEFLHMSSNQVSCQWCHVSAFFIIIVLLPLSWNYYSFFLQKLVLANLLIDLDNTFGLGAMIFESSFLSCLSLRGDMHLLIMSCHVEAQLLKSPRRFSILLSCLAMMSLTKLVKYDFRLILNSSLW